MVEVLDLLFFVSKSLLTISTKARGLRPRYSRDIWKHFSSKCSSKRLQLKSSALYLSVVWKKIRPFRGGRGGVGGGERGSLAFRVSMPRDIRKRFFRHYLLSFKIYPAKCRRKTVHMIFSAARVICLKEIYHQKIKSLVCECRSVVKVMKKKIRL